MFFRRKPTTATPPPYPFDPKPLRITVTLADGQNRTWAMGPGDGVGLGDVRVDVLGAAEVAVTVLPDDPPKERRPYPAKTRPSVKIAR